MRTIRYKSSTDGEWRPLGHLRIDIQLVLGPRRKHWKPLRCLKQEDNQSCKTVERWGASRGGGENCGRKLEARDDREGGVKTWAYLDGNSWSWKSHKRSANVPPVDLRANNHECDNRKDCRSEQDHQRHFASERYRLHKELVEAVHANVSCRQQNRR